MNNWVTPDAAEPPAFVDTFELDGEHDDDRRDTLPVRLDPPVLVHEGLSNPEIAARLFLGPHTVEWHMSEIFSKLDITSRRPLGRR